MNIRALIAEFIGTFTLTFVGAGAIVTDQRWSLENGD